jgi:hypothetical protein
MEARVSGPREEGGEDTGKAEGAERTVESGFFV